MAELDKGYVPKSIQKKNAATRGGTTVSLNDKR